MKLRVIYNDNKRIIEGETPAKALFNLAKRRNIELSDSDIEAINDGEIFGIMDILCNKINLTFVQDYETGYTYLDECFE